MSTFSRSELLNAVYKWSHTCTHTCMHGHYQSGSLWGSVCVESIRGPAVFAASRHYHPSLFLSLLLMHYVWAHLSNLVHFSHSDCVALKCIYKQTCFPEIACRFSYVLPQKFPHFDWYQLPCYQVVLFLEKDWVGLANYCESICFKGIIRYFGNKTCHFLDKSLMRRSRLSFQYD